MLAISETLEKHFRNKCRDYAYDRLPNGSRNPYMVNEKAAQLARTIKDEIICLDANKYEVCFYLLFCFHSLSSLLFII